MSEIRFNVASQPSRKRVVHCANILVPEVGTMAALGRDDHFLSSAEATNEIRARARLPVFVGALFLVTFFAYAQSSAQSAGFGICRPVSERTGEVGCWIIPDTPVGRLDQPQVFWYLDVYPTRAAAEKAKEAGGNVLESLGKVWLLTIGKAGWRPSAEGERIAEIGPIPVIAGREYSALYMEAILDPGMTSAIHTHSGPEAWLTVAGETCLETPEGKFVGRPGGRSVIVPAGSPMLLTATGAEQRRALTLILHESSERPTTVVHDWTPKGLCKK
jgi:quercetin dioxygenase-like cupin family protein